MDWHGEREPKMRVCGVAPIVTLDRVPWSHESHERALLKLQAVSLSDVR